MIPRYNIRVPISPIHNWNWVNCYYYYYYYYYFSNLTRGFVLFAELDKMLKIPPVHACTPNTLRFGNTMVGKPDSWLFELRSAHSSLHHWVITDPRPDSPCIMSDPVCNGSVLCQVV